jgi:hypothetical protein
MNICMYACTTKAVLQYAHMCILQSSMVQYCTISSLYNYLVPYYNRTRVLYSENMRRDVWNLTYVWGGIVLKYFELKFQRFEVNPDL